MRQFCPPETQAWLQASGKHGSSSQEMGSIISDRKFSLYTLSQNFSRYTPFDCCFLASAITMQKLYLVDFIRMKPLQSAH